MTHSPAPPPTGKLLDGGEQHAEGRESSILTLSQVSGGREVEFTDAGSSMAINKILTKPVSH